MTVTLAARLGLGLGLGPGVTEAEGPEVNLVTVPSGTLGHCYIALFLAIYHLGYIAPAYAIRGMIKRGRCAIKT